MIVNGQPLKLDKPRTLTEVLAIAGYDKSPVAVLLNDRVSPMAQRDQTEINDDDVLEIIAFVGGG
jgi:thiamine biosynthesis protein ThiS